MYSTVCILLLFAYQTEGLAANGGVPYLIFYYFLCLPACLSACLSVDQAVLMQGKIMCKGAGTII